MPKPLLSVSDSSPSGLGPPLYMNGGLIGSMDSIVALQNLRGGIPGIPISGIMAAGFSHGFPAAVSAGGSGAEDVKNGLSMLPMMLHGIPHPHGATIPQHALFSVGTMMAHAPPPPPPHSVSASPSSSTSPPASAANVTTTTAPSEAASPSSTTPTDRDGASSSATGGDKEKGTGEGAKRPSGVESAVIASASRAHLSSAHLGTAAGSHHAFNPFLIPGVSHGLLYPHMFLPHGSIMALPAVLPGAVDASPGSPKRRRKRAREEEEKVAAGDAEENPHLAASSFSASSTSALEPPPAEETGLGGATNGPSEPQKPDSNSQDEGAATEDGQEETGGEAEQRQEV